MPRRRKPVFKDPDWSTTRRGRRPAERIVLTDEIVVSADTTKSERSIHDSEVAGFFIRIRASGSKTYHYRQPGIRNKHAISLGRADDMPVAEARAAAVRIQNDRASGRMSRFSSGGPSHLTVARAFDEYIATRPSSDWTRRIRRTFNETILPIIGSVKLSKLDGDAALRPFAELEGYYRVGTPAHILSAFLTWAVRVGHIRFNVLRGRISLPIRPHPNTCAVSKDGIGRFWRACDALPPIWCIAFRLMIATRRPIREVLSLTSRNLPDWPYGGEMSPPERTPMIDQLLKTLSPNAGGFMFSAPGKRTALTFQQRHWNKLRELAQNPYSTTRDLAKGVDFQFAELGRNSTKWDEFLHFCMEQPHQLEEAEL